MTEKQSPEEVKKLLEEMRKWADEHPLIPKNIDDHLLLRFLHSCYYDLEKGKKTAELFFTIRASCPNLLNNRDPLSPAIQKALSIVNIAQYQISGKRNVWIWQLNDPGLEIYDYVTDAKLFYLTTDSWLLDDKPLEESDIVIMDVKDMSLKMLTKFSLSDARKLSKYQQDAMPIRIKQVHMINSPPAMDKIFSLIKPFLRSEMTQMIHFHPPKSTNLFKYLNKDELPEDFGGTHGKLVDYKKIIVDSLLSKREYFIDDTFWKAEKKDKSKNKTENDKDKDITSFRSLAID